MFGSSSSLAHLGPSILPQRTPSPGSCSPTPHGLPLVERIVLDAHTSLGWWRITELPTDLRPRLVFSKNEEEFVARISNEKRRTQWMASRVLLKTLIGTDGFVEMFVDQYGRPEVENFDLRISISHTHDYAAVILSDRYTVGIDVEQVKPDLDRIKGKFMRPDELAHMPDDEDALTYVLLHWSAKEVMYKIYARRKLDFREHMGVHPFELQPDKGVFHGWTAKGDYDRGFTMHYRRLGDYYVVWAVDMESELD